MEFRMVYASEHFSEYLAGKNRGRRRTFIKLGKSIFTTYKESLGLIKVRKWKKVYLKAKFIKRSSPTDFLWECVSFIAAKICSPPSVLATILSLPSFKDASRELISAKNSKGVTLVAKLISLAVFVPEPTEEINFGPRYPCPIIPK